MCGLCTRINGLAAERRGSRRPHPGSRRVPERLAARASDDDEVVRLLHSKGIVASQEVVLYGDGADDVAAGREQARRPRPRDGARPTSDGWRDWAADETPAARAPARTTTSSSTPTGSASVLAGEPPRPRQPEVPALPRQLRRPGGVRGGPSPRRALPRHQPAREPGRLEPPHAGGARRRPARARHHPRHDGHPLRPRYRGRRQREVAGPPGRPDRRHARRADPALRRRRRRPPARRRLRRVGPGGQPARDHAPRADARRVVRRPDPARARTSSSTSTRPRRSSPTGRRRPRQRADLERAHRQGQRLQLHRPGRPDRRRRLGQLRHGRVPHAALPQRRQHDARLPGDRRQLGGGRHHARQVGRLLLRHRLAGERDLVLRLPMGWQRIAVYDGGWFEWSQDPVNNPIEVGEPVEELAA